MWSKPFGELRGLQTDKGNGAIFSSFDIVDGQSVLCVPIGLSRHMAFFLDIGKRSILCGFKIRLKSLLTRTKGGGCRHDESGTD